MHFTRRPGAAQEAQEDSHCKGERCTAEGPCNQGLSHSSHVYSSLTYCQPAKAAKVPATKAKGKTTKAPAVKKTRAAKAKLLRTDSADPETDKATNEGDLSADDEATSSTNGEAKGKLNPATANKLAKSILSAKRKAEEMDTESDGKVAVKKEKVESEDESENGKEQDAQEEDAKRAGGPPNDEMMWEELTYGMNTDGMDGL